MTQKTFHWIFGCALLFSTHAHAWVALAYDDYAGMTYISRHPASAERAQAEALEGCRQRVDKARCRVLGVAAQGEAMVVVRGINALNGRGHVTTAVDSDAEQARHLALTDCAQAGNYHCTVVDALWDAGANWSALARSDDVFYFAHDANTAEAARANAMAGCKARSAVADRCAIVGPSVSDAHAWVVFVESGASKFYAHDEDRAVAEAEGLSACRGTAPQPHLCHVVAGYENARPVPAAFTRVSEEAQQGDVRLLRARRVFNHWIARQPASEARPRARDNGPLWIAGLAR